MKHQFLCTAGKEPIMSNNYSIFNLTFNTIKIKSNQFKF